MFSPNTLLVVGAGASCEVRMPSGYQLARTIASIANVHRDNYGNESTGDQELLALVTTIYRNDYGPRLEAMRQIARGIGTAPSIDAYIDRHAHVPYVPAMGKLLIAYQLLIAENHSELAVQNRNDELNLRRFETTWLNSLAQMLFDGVRRPDAGRIGAGLKIICFNYDRCIERYLLEAVRQGYDMTAIEAYQIVSRIKIIRPYGGLGPLPVVSSGGSGLDAVAFGQSPLDSALLPGIAQRLFTYTERVDDPALLQSIRDAVTEAEEVVFLGFAFHRQNMELLRSQEVGPSKRFLASGLGLSQPDADSVESDCRGLGRTPNDRPHKGVVVSLGTKAADLLKTYRRSLTA